MHYSKHTDARGFVFYVSKTTKLSISGALICVTHHLRVYPDKQEHWLFFKAELMKDTKSIEAEFVVEVWDNSVNGQKLCIVNERNFVLLKYTFLPASSGNGCQIKSPVIKDIHAIFTLKKWLVINK